MKKKLPEKFDYNEISGLRIEAQQKLNEFQPLNIGQASRISGVTPADISVLLVYLEQLKYSNPDLFFKLNPDEQKEKQGHIIHKQVINLRKTRIRVHSFPPALYHSLASFYGKSKVDYSSRNLYTECIS